MRIIDLNTLSLVGGSGIAEEKQTIWSADGTYSAGTHAGTSGSYFIADGANGDVTGGSQTHLFILSSTWSPNIQYAFEIWAAQNDYPYAAYAALWDFTSSSIVTNSTLTVDPGQTGTYYNYRTSKLTLTPGHTYGITVWTTNTSYGGILLTDASLIIFP